MDPIQALWYLLLLLKINQTYLIQSKPGCSNYEAITDVLKTSRCPRQLGKNISSPDFESLLHAAGILKLKGATGRIEINKKVIESKLSVYFMIVEAQNQQQSQHAQWQHARGGGAVGVYCPPREQLLVYIGVFHIPRWCPQNFQNPPTT